MHCMQGGYEEWLRPFQIQRFSGSPNGFGSRSAVLTLLAPSVDERQPGEVAKGAQDVTTC